MMHNNSRPPPATAAVQGTTSISFSCWCTTTQEMAKHCTCLHSKASSLLLSNTVCWRLAEDLDLCNHRRIQSNCLKRSSDHASNEILSYSIVRSRSTDIRHLLVGVGPKFEKKTHHIFGTFDSCKRKKQMQTKSLYFHRLQCTHSWNQNSYNI